MKYGISSSALFGRMETDQALAFLRDCGICECVEVFFQCPDEYSGQYRNARAQHSVHAHAQLIV